MAMLNNQMVTIQQITVAEARFSRACHAIFFPRLSGDVTCDVVRRATDPLVTCCVAINRCDWTSCGYTHGFLRSSFKRHWMLPKNISNTVNQTLVGRIPTPLKYTSQLGWLFHIIEIYHDISGKITHILGIMIFAPTIGFTIGVRSEIIPKPSTPVPDRSPLWAVLQPAWKPREANDRLPPVTTRWSWK